MQKVQSYAFISLSILVVIAVLSFINFSAYSKNSERTITDEILNNKQPVSCCGGQTAEVNETYKLLGSYYSLKDGQNVVLMFNNKGNSPLPVNPIIYNLNGERLDLPSLTISAEGYQEFNLQELLANHLPQFEEGSLQITHQGAKLQLGVQIKILKQAMIFDEQLVQTSRFVSSRLENVWYLSSQHDKTKVILSNTTDLPLTAVVKIDGTAPVQHQPAQIQLNPHQTRVLDILKDLVGKQHGGTVHKKGGISITHSGSAGEVLARMLVSNEESGFSVAANFIDPEMTASSKWNGTGLRLNLNGQNLNQILVVRNIGNNATTVSGRIPYTKKNGQVKLVEIPTTNISPQKTKVIDLDEAIESANVPSNVKYAGVEAEYTTEHGSVVMMALSVSDDENQVFKVTLSDPQKSASSAGGYPWKADNGYSTILYIKNETTETQKYIARLKHESGDYVLDVKELKARETTAIDFREIRDAQTPDKAGRAIPLNVERGQIAWSVYGNENKTLNGRSEQVNLSEGISTTYDCRNCCPDSFIIDGVIPGSSEVEVGGQINFFLDTRIENCYGSSGSTPMPGSDWLTSDASVGTINSEGLAEGVSPGYVTFTTSWINHVWHFQSIDLDCLVDDILGGGSGGMDVIPRIDILQDGQDITNTTQTIIVGQQINLSATVSAGGTISNKQWTIPGNKVSNYVVTSTTGTVTEFNNQSLSQETVQFYWVDGEDNREVKFTVTVNGRSFSAKATFNVKRPTVTVTTETSETNIRSNRELIFAKTRTPLKAGIEFTRSGFEIPAGFSGDTVWAQIVNYSFTKTFVATGQQQTTSDAGLDTVFPYSSNDPNATFTRDSPGVCLEGCVFSQINRAQIALNAEMWLMFKPSGSTSIYVPLKKVSWFWSATATKDADGIWTHSNASNSNNSSGLNTKSFPQWTKVVGSIQ